MIIRMLAAGARLWGMDDFFDLPLGYIAPDPDPDDDSIGVSPIPPGAYDHPGKWLGLRAGKLLAIRDTSEELEALFGARPHQVSFFHVPTTTVFAR
jgi:hypothetical protein